jgi:hypothetical protein
VAVAAPPSSRPPLGRRTGRSWLVAWVLVLLIPVATLALRLLDASAYAALVSPLAWGFAGLIGAALAAAGLASWRRSGLRAALGLAAVLAVAGLLLWPLTHVTLGRTPCPPRAGDELGAAVAVVALGAWRERGTSHAAWQAGWTDPGWSARARSGRLLDFGRVGSGCWDRVAPVDATRTWHEFRVTVQGRDDPSPLSKVVVVHTAAVAEGWKITAIEGPLP